MTTNTLPTLAPFTFRHFQGENDFPKMLPVAQAARDADKVEDAMTLEDLRHYYAHLSNCDPYTDMVFAEANSEVVGYSRVFWNQENDGTRIYVMFGAVHPAWRRQGLGRALYRWGENRLREIAATHPAGPRSFRNFAQETEVAKIKLLTGEGYAPIRYAYDMVRPNLEDIPAALMPEGLEVRPVLPEHYRAIWEAEVEAFRDHWGAGEQTEEDYQRFLGGREFQPDLWKVAWDVSTNAVAGMVLGFIDEAHNAKFNRRRGWTENISTRRPWRKRGLASALIAENLRELKARGLTEAALGVDSENPTGALRVYERMGFQVVKRSAAYCKEF
jgi:mycothiol synthase